ncbi:hypothetical protein M2137_001287 [Parabacteroides sp. PFB2-10]|nr:hypothetical protein [Parabacteroides sp. PFB2-10]
MQSESHGSLIMLCIKPGSNTYTAFRLISKLLTEWVRAPTEM